MFLLVILAVEMVRAQQIGEGKAQDASDFNRPLLSGVYQGWGESLFPGKVPDVMHEWNHLLVLRHSNLFNNHQLQIASGYSENDRLFFRKIATNDLNASSTSPWYELATRGTNRFTGNIGIGGVTPIVPLHVSASADIEDGTKASAILGKAYNEYVYIGGLKSGRLRGGPGEGYLVVESYPTGTNNGLYLNPNTSGDIVIGQGGGRTIIGSPTGVADKSHKLFVNGGIRTDKVTVDNVTTWADFVFAPTYKLKPLSEIATFIEENGRLPEIPSEEEVKSSGINLVEMNVKLLQKVEELTLYLIEKNKRIEELQKQVNDIKQQLKNNL